MRFWAAAALVLLLACPAGAGQFGGRPLHVTDGRTDDRPAALVIALHGFLSTASGMQRKTSFDALARRDGFVVAYPSGKALRWNHAGSDPDDVAYLSALIANLVAQGIAHPARIYLAGHSNGGAMALRMACDRPALIAGVAVASMNVPAAGLCAQGRAMPMLFIHGDADPVVPPEGVAGKRARQDVISVKDTLSLWARRNGCQPAPLRKGLDRGTIGEVTQFHRYRGCRAPLLHVVIKGQGHEWPGAGPRARWIQGPASPHVDAASLSWWFFNALRSPR